MIDQTQPDQLSKQDRIIIEAALRASRAHNSLGITQAQRNVVYAFVLVDGSWSASSLADYISVPRTTVLRILKAGETRGIWEKTSKGWVLKPDQRPLALQFVRETSEIVMGKRQSYSRAILDSAGQKEAVKFNFYPFDNG